MTADARVHVTTVVRVDPTRAFDVFAQQTELWWRRQARFRFAAGGPEGVLRIEAGVGGRVLDVVEGAAPEVLGEVLVWDRPRALRFSLRARQPMGRTEVEVTFEDTARGTRVSVTHHGWGPRPVAIKNLLSVLWGDLLTTLARELHREPS